MKQKSKYPEPKRIRAGRNLFVCDFDKKPLVGLSWDRGNGQYYFTFFKSEKDFQAGKATRKDYSFGVHYQDAIFKFNQWKKDNQKISLTIPTADARAEQIITKKLSPTEQQNLKDIYTDLGIDKEVPKEFTFSGEGFSQSDNISIKSIFTTDKKYALYLLKQLLQDEELRIEAIRTLKLDDLLPKQFKPLPVKDVLQYYIDENDCSDEEKRKVKRAVDFFAKSVKKKNVNDITEDDISLYRDIVKKSKFSSTVKNGYLGKVKTIFNFYNENKKGNGEKELVRQVLGYCAVLKKLDDIIQDPAKSLDCKTVKKIFKQAENDNELMQGGELLLVFLLMLNTGFYPTDIRHLKKSMIKEKDVLTYILFSRRKTKEQFVRVNCLWSITAKLLKEQCKRYPDSEFVFISQAGSMYAESTLGKKFTEFFKELTKEDKPSISAKHFRDTVASELAFDVTNINIIKVTLGHSIKSTKDEFWKYIDSRPEQQKPASDILFEKFREAIEMI